LRTSTSGINGAPALSADTDGYSISGTSPFSGSAPLARMGSMLLFDRTEPNGYPEAANGWISGGTLAERLRFVQSVLTAAGQSGKSDSGNNNTSDPLGLLQVYLPVQTPPGSTSNDANVVDFILGILFPGEGTANLGAYRAAALKYLNTDDFGNPSPFGSLTVSRTPGSTYDNRLRGMVAMLLTLPRFQEQ
jgi:hypothetical protein